ncbi:hypothetical protein [Streptomyces sp. A012304]|uniref:hypothetical protein n=1 Tax=Streptomyces sp. A012304 TaxID=375446 RepID=UPI0022312369|nr:hypothetical protein [Streptomyces sp. A012304]GKQ34580.1 hypothetical protein ALMP_11290 [Streptomyces sp. A012304]
MKTRTAACAALLALAALTTGCSDGDGGSIADEPACKKAMAERLKETMPTGKTPDAKVNPACVGLDQQTLERLAGETLNEYLESDQAKKDFEEAIESAIPTPDFGDLDNLPTP